MSEKLPGSRSSFRLPWFVQLGAGLAFVALIYLIGISSTSYVSEWDEQNSSDYETSMQALRMFSLHPTAPTAIIFWEQGNEDSQKTIRAFRSSPSNLRIYGIHAGEADSQVALRRAWLKSAPPSSQLILDKSDLLKTSFRVKSYPRVFIILPKQKKLWSYWGDVNKSREKMLEIISSESSRL